MISIRPAIKEDGCRVREWLRACHAGGLRDAPHTSRHTGHSTQLQLVQPRPRPAWHTRTPAVLGASSGITRFTARAAQSPCVTQGADTSLCHFSRIPPSFVSPTGGTNQWAAQRGALVRTGREERVRLSLFPQTMAMPGVLSLVVVPQTCSGRSIQADYGHQCLEIQAKRLDPFYLPSCLMRGFQKQILWKTADDLHVTGRDRNNLLTSLLISTSPTVCKCKLGNRPLSSHC